MFAELFIAEYNHEMISTLKMLERTPFDKFNWKPHDKSMSLGELVTHIADTAIFGANIASASELDFATMPKPEPIKSTQELVERYTANIAASTKALQGVSDMTLGQEWTMRNGETIIFKMPRGVALRSLGLNHMFHHRGQLSVYLRLLNVPIPSIYGPSADEGRLAA